VIIPRHRAVHCDADVAKAAAGAVEYVPMALVGGLPAALARAKEAGIWWSPRRRVRRDCSTSRTGQRRNLPRARAEVPLSRLVRERWT